MRRLLMTIFVFPFLLAFLQSQEYWLPVNTGITNQNARALFADGDNIFAGTHGGGVFITTNKGVSWKASNSGMSNRVSCFEKNGTNIFAGTPSEGMYISSSGGKQWKKINDGLTNWKISGIVVAGDKVIAATAGSGVFATTNNGTSWSPSNRGLDNWNVSCIYKNGTNIFLGTSDAGVYLSTDNGSNWSAVNSYLPYLTISCLTGDGRTLYAGTLNRGVFMTTNNGQSWSSINSKLVNLNILCMTIWNSSLIVGTDGGGIYITSDQGDHWSETNTGLLNLRPMALMPLGTDLFLATDGGGVYAHKGNTLPSVTTQAVTAIGTVKVTVNAIISDDGGVKATSRGACWSKHPSPTKSDSCKEESGDFGEGAFTIDISTLNPNTAYYTKAFATNIMGTGYGLVKSFLTLPNPPTLNDASGIDFTKFTITWNKPVPEGSEDYTYTLEVSLNSVYTSPIDSSPFSGLKVMSKEIKGLKEGTDYYYRIKCVNSTGSSSWAEWHTKTLATISVPSLTTGNPTSITETGATGNGNITSGGGASITKRGFCWNTTGKPTTADSKTEESGDFQTGAYTASIASLTANTKYFLNSYAVNSKGTGYGQDVFLITLPNAPVCNTPDNLTHNSVTLKWSAPYPAGSEVLTYKIEVTSDAAYTNQISGSPFTGETALSKDLNSLSQKTKYYYRISAVNQTGSSKWCTGDFTTQEFQSVDDELEGKASKSFILGTIYPIPAESYVEIPLELLKDGIISIEICSVLGERALLLADRQLFAAGKYNFRANIATLPAGMYKITLKNDSEIISKGIVISR